MARRNQQDSSDVTGPPRGGRSLLEVMIVFAIIAGMASLFVPLLVKLRELSRRQTCARNLVQLGKADLHHELVYGHLVPARLGPDSTSHRAFFRLVTPEERSGASGFVLMLPMIDAIPRLVKQDLVSKIDVRRNGSIWPAGIFGPSEIWRNPEREEAIGTRPSVFVCPAAGDLPQTALPQFQSWEVVPATGNYAFVAGHRGLIFGAFGVNVCMVKHHNTGAHLYLTKRSLNDIVDGASNTISVGEVIDSHTANSSNIWTYCLRYLDSFRVTDVPLNTLPSVLGARAGGGSADSVNGAFASKHPKGANFVYCDGHVGFMKDSIDHHVYQNLSTIDGTPAERDAIDEDFCSFEFGR